MRKSLRLVVAVASVLAATTASLAPQPSLAQDAVPGVVDLAASIASKPVTVSPPGELVLLAVGVRNVGLLQADAEVAVDLAPGMVYRDDLSSSACTPSGSDVLCAAGAVPAGGSASFDVVAHTAPDPGAQVSTATANSVGVTEPLEYQSNNSQSATTTVTAGNNLYAAGLVESGDSLTLTVGDGRVFTITVPAEVPGVIVRELSPRDGTGYLCGTYVCGNGFYLDFVPHPHFKAEDMNHPLVTHRTFGALPPCRGLGNSCSDTYYSASDAPGAVLLPTPWCEGASGSSSGSGTGPAPRCINQKYKSGGATWFDIRLLTIDPLELPPYLNSLNNG